MSSYIEVVRRPKTPFEKVMSLIVSLCCCFAVIVCAVVCVATLNCKMNNVVSSVAGYSAVTIAPTGSMTNSGFEAWQIVLVKKVNPRALKGDQVDENGNVTVRGDIIAYYRYLDSRKQDINSLPVYTSAMASQEEESVSLSMSEFFGGQNTTIMNAGKSNCAMVFHHIKEIREDENGKLFFKTYGSSNLDYYGNISPDPYWISEDVLVGKYYEDGNPILLSVFQIFASSAGIIILICIPLLVMMFFVVLDILRGLSLAMLEDSVLKGKLSLTDPVCVVNNIGFNMSQKTKYRVLAQLSPQERIESVSYLWQSPKDVQAMKKHYIKQKLLMHYDEERLALKNEFANQLSVSGKKAVVAEREYNKRLRDIEKREYSTIKKLKDISKRANLDMRLEGYKEIDDKLSLKNAKVKLKKGETLHIGPHKSAEAKKIVSKLEKASQSISVGDINNQSIDIQEAIEVFDSINKKFKDEE